MLNIKQDSARGLRSALRANAVFSAISGLLIVFAHDQVLAWLGINGLNISAIGGGLILFSAYLFWMSSRTSLLRVLVSGVIAGDWAWVAGSAALVIFKAASFSTMGLFLIVDVALAVMVFAIWQQRGLKNAAMNT